MENNKIKMRESEPITVNFTLLEDKDFEKANNAYELMKTYKERYLKPKIDYDVIPGCGNKATLLKPGAEKLVRLFRLRPYFEIVDCIVDYEKNLFHYHYRCSLYRDNVMVGQCDGIASSRESKFSKAVLSCPECGKEDTLMKSKFKPGHHYCNPKSGGCGQNVLSDCIDTGTESFNYNAINTMCKIAIKRSLVGAVLIVCGASMYFTQDLDDYHN